MLAIILIGVFGGLKLDQVVTSIEFPLFTLIFSVAGVALSIYYGIKDFIK